MCILRGVVSVRPSRCLVMCILRGALFCASFEMPCYVHPSRCCFCASFEVPCYVHPSSCCVLCILRDALLCASFEVLCFVHPSRCFTRVHTSGCLDVCIRRGALHPSRCCVLCILRVALLCASFVVLYFVHPPRCLVVGCARGQEKCLPPFWCIPPGGLLGDVGLGDTQGFYFCKKTSPPLPACCPRGSFRRLPFAGANSLRQKLVGFCWLPDVSFEKLLSSEVTLVRVVFL